MCLRSRASRGARRASSLARCRGCSRSCTALPLRVSAITRPRASSSATLRSIREAATSSTQGKLGGLLLRKDLQALRQEIDPEAQGGAYMLGLRKLGIVPHGRFSRIGFSQAILLAARGVRNDVVGQTYAALGEAGALKGAPPLASASSNTVEPTP